MSTDPGGMVDRLTHHRGLGGVPPAELAWLAAHGTPRSYQPGDVTTRKHQPEESLQIVLSGHLAIHVDRGAGSRKIIDWRTGDVCGLMPYSRGGAPPGDTVAREPTDTLSIHRDLLPMMIRECPSVTARLVHAMLDRARHFTSGELHDEKLVSLGKLAAGLAHELNNPASAAVRSAKLLSQSLTEGEGPARALAALQLSAAQLQAIDAVRDVCRSSTAGALTSSMEGADRADAVGSWLTAREIDDSIAAPLADAGITTAVLDTMVASVRGAALDASLAWIAGECLIRRLASDIEISATRIYDLVTAVKGFTYMDRSPTPELVDLQLGIADTLTMLAAKIRTKSVAIHVSVAPDLPRVRALGAELNQVWSNLIDNALDAVSDSGRIDVTASREVNRAVVRVIDDGPGIPLENQGRVFDPFFTTKGVGRGTGLGLDIVRRLLQRNDGEIELDSAPGRTEFRVSLPIDEAK